jgi:hypothetical protein
MLKRIWLVTDVRCCSKRLLTNGEPGREVLVGRKRVRERDDLLSWRRY